MANSLRPICVFLDKLSIDCNDLNLSAIATATDLTLYDRSSAHIINTARGGIINEVDLLKALKTGLIAGARLDCLSQEPPRIDDPLITADLEQLIITPHNAWGTHQTRQKLVDGTTENIINYISGKPRH
jgi:lactate dehydrogenase-like 2-hydroxyacid dehydrogenase